MYRAFTSSPKESLDEPDESMYAMVDASAALIREAFFSNSLATLDAQKSSHLLFQMIHWWPDHPRLVLSLRTGCDALVHLLLAAPRFDTEGVLYYIPDSALTHVVVAVNRTLSLHPGYFSNYIATAGRTLLACCQEESTPIVVRLTLNESIELLRDRGGTLTSRANERLRWLQDLMAVAPWATKAVTNRRGIQRVVNMLSKNRNYPSVLPNGLAILLAVSNENQHQNEILRSKGGE